MLISPVGISVYSGKNKESVKNSLECLKEHNKNNIKSCIKMSAGMLGSTSAGLGIIKASNYNLADCISDAVAGSVYESVLKNAKGLKKIPAAVELGLYKLQKAVVGFMMKNQVQELIKKSDELINKGTSGVLERVSDVFKEKGVKTGAVVVGAGIALTALSVLVKYCYEAGKINQKYKNKAESENTDNKDQKPEKSGKKIETLAEKILKIKIGKTESKDSLTD